jgi:hypothetical protein
MHEDVVDEDFRVDESEPFAVNQSFGEGGRTHTCWRKVGVTTICMDGNGLAQTKKSKLESRPSSRREIPFSLAPLNKLR